jgi:hypothetical protein
MWFPVPAPDWGVGVATRAIAVDPTVAWGVLLAVLAIACVSLWLLGKLDREAPRKPETQREAPRLRLAA